MAEERTAQPARRNWTNVKHSCILDRMNDVRALWKEKLVAIASDALERAGQARRDGRESDLDVFDRAVKLLEGLDSLQLVRALKLEATAPSAG